jgi:lipid-A-disaccharide synthase
MTTNPKQILITAFEPSGDALAAGVVLKMKQQQPDLIIYAMGGDKLKAAGAILIEHTTDHAAMGLGALSQFQTHRKRLKHLKKWLKSNPIDMLVPVDSPAANWSICKLVKDNVPNVKVIHLVAPQVWAWATWRVKRLQKWSDGVLCLLPFEPDWFKQHNVPALFIGHPVFDNDCHAPGSDDEAQYLPQGELHLVLLPGSRRGEIKKNWPTMVRACRELLKQHKNVQVIVAALDKRLADMINELTTEAECDDLWKSRLTMTIGQTESVLRWSHVALATSGTVTLQIAAHGKPMVAMYNTGRIFYNTFRCLLAQHTFTLPNLISEWQSGKRVITELVPHFGSVPPVVKAVNALLNSSDKRSEQQADLATVISAFADKRFSEQGAQALLEKLNQSH